MKTNNQHPYLRAMIIAALTFCVALCGLLYKFGLPGENGVEAITRLFCTVASPALIVGWFANRAPEKWSFKKMVGAYLAAVAVVAVLLAIRPS
ncbi:hypothetical protein RMR16_024870 (plasmid) [Agrobacterium sp. rho-13.3]|uniref:hypothetical protein n=1 Tax=Agrobacterium sp. rho-13.3 TaxID=3072980 RepID=UPI002A0CE342|nr:hypothetical protein [Agrobacterium sp. rho-13.3]MDX8310186.1 hypothetical protein [Agrobacterium sp. rho-13.3]